MIRVPVKECSQLSSFRLLHGTKRSQRLRMQGLYRQDTNCGVSGRMPAPIDAVSRRHGLISGLATVSVSLGCLALLEPTSAIAVPLAPLGGLTRIGGEKLTGLSDDQVKAILNKDLDEGQYFVTGNLTKEIFTDDCRFVDPTNDVTGLQRYVTALGILFDPEFSTVKLKDIQVTKPRTIEADYISGGYLKEKFFPWRPRVEAYEGHVVYTLNDQGLVAVQSQTWSISPFEALKETFTPTFGPREPVRLQ